MKNRKSARECRKKRKEERTGMMDELIQLRNDKIKLMAEVDVLTKQLQRLEDKERQGKKLDVSPPAPVSARHASKIGEQHTSSGFCFPSNQSQANSERSIEAKIDEALTAKLHAFNSMFELKVTEIVQHELKKLTSQTLDNKCSSLFDDDVKQSPETNSVSCQLYQ